MSEISLTARYIFPVDQPPIRNGVVAIRDGRITAVERHGMRTADDDLGNVALLPGFVNSHTHLDLSGLAGQCPPTPDFTGWLRSVVAHRRRQTGDEITEHIRDGLRQVLQTGTTLIGDISSDELVQSALAESPVWSVLYYEMLGLPSDRAKQSWESAQQWLIEWPDSDRCRPGLSPHAPYSVHRRLLRWAAESEFPVTVHLAETLAESQLLANHAGPFVSFLDELGVWEPGGLVADVDDVVDMFRNHPRTIFAHGNYLNAKDLNLRNATIVYCPRTHHAFGHEPHPFRSMLKQGVRVALGTDSLASNPDLDMLAETRFFHRQHPDVPGDVLLRMATLNGAEALGFHNVTGSLTVGKSADLIVLSLPNDEPNDPHELIWKSDAAVDRVMWRGPWRVY